MTVTTSVCCDQGRPGPRCPERLDLEVPMSMTTAIAAELRRSGWTALRSGRHFCPEHTRERGERA